jgi:flavin reductase (DIM6/NTAB) family NADH-FMN oxidoreductase RutF
LERKAFTVCVPSVTHAKEADYFGIVSGKSTDKFATSGPTPIKSDVVDAPYVEEFPLALECKVIHSLELGLHTLFVGEVLDIKADAEILGEKGLPDMQKFKPFSYNPEIRTYFAVGEYIGKAFQIGKEIR